LSAANPAWTGRLPKAICLLVGKFTSQKTITKGKCFDYFHKSHRALLCHCVTPSHCTANNETRLCCTAYTHLLRPSWGMIKWHSQISHLWYYAVYKHSFTIIRSYSAECTLTWIQNIGGLKVQCRISEFNYISIESRGVCVAFLFPILKVSGSNLDPDTIYREIFKNFLICLQKNAGIVPQMRPPSLSSTSSRIQHSLSFQSFNARQVSLNYWIHC
jgi:hypothetical protein